MEPVLDVDEVIRIEKKLAASGTPLLELMMRAGRAVAQTAQEMLPSPEARIVVLAGSGNNGGDGWVAANELTQAGYEVVLATKRPAEELTAEPARTAASSSKELRYKSNIVVNPDIDTLRNLVNESDLIIDAILGTGFTHTEVRTPYDWWITLANESKTPVLAIDCPSGLNAQTGIAAQTCIKANETVTMIAVKTGLIKECASPYVGHITLATLGVDVSTFPS